MKLQEIFNLADLQKMMDEGYVTKRKHPVMDLWILNYAAGCQYDKMWNDVTMNCRGLIVDGDDNVIARCIPKFMNYEQVLDKIPDEEFEITEKADGSYIVVYLDADGQYSCSTRGSFSSEQAIDATKILREKYGRWFRDRYEFLENKSMIFEYIAPDNRIVVDYKGMRDLIFITALDNLTGEDIPLNMEFPFPRVKKYDFKDITKIKELNWENSEGFVIRFSSGFRCKIKFDEYCRLHRILTGVSEKHIWEELMLGNTLEKYIENVPDEFYQFVQDTEKKLKEAYGVVETRLGEFFSMMPQVFDTRKDSALWIMDNVPVQYRSIMFNLVDGKDYSKQIWKMLEPKGGGKVFKRDESEV